MDRLPDSPEQRTLKRSASTPKLPRVKKDTIGKFSGAPTPSIDGDERKHLRDVQELNPANTKKLLKRHQSTKNLANTSTTSIITIKAAKENVANELHATTDQEHSEDSQSTTQQKQQTITPTSSTEDISNANSKKIKRSLSQRRKSLYLPKTKSLDEEIKHTIPPELQTKFAFEKFGYSVTPGMTPQYFLDTKSNNLKAFDAGQTQAVLSGTAIDPETKETINIVVKREVPMDEDKNTWIKIFKGINLEAPKNTHRNVLVYRLGGLINFPLGNPIVKCSPAIYQNNLALVMEKADGISALGKKVRVKLEGQDLIDFLKVKKQDEASENPQFSNIYEDMEYHSNFPKLRAEDKMQTISIDGKKVKVPVYTYEAHVVDQEINFDDPDVKDQFDLMQLLFATAVHPDQHVDNIRIQVDDQGNIVHIKAYDLDGCFGPKEANYEAIVRNNRLNLMGYPPSLSPKACEAFLKLTEPLFIQYQQEIFGKDNNELPAGLKQLEEVRNHVIKVQADRGHLKDNKGNPVRVHIGNSLHLQTREVHRANLAKTPEIKQKIYTPKK